MHVHAMLRLVKVVLNHSQVAEGRPFLLEDLIRKRNDFRQENKMQAIIKNRFVREFAAIAVAALLVVLVKQGIQIGGPF